MDRPRIALALGLLTVALTLACDGGGGSSPTAPAGPLTSVEGVWRGEMRNGITGVPFRCTLTVVFGPPNRGDELTDYDGTLTVDCGDGSAGGTAFFVVPDSTLFPRLFGAFSSEVPGVAGPLYECGWGSFVMLQGRRMDGDWQPADGCEDPDFPGGPFALTFDG